MRAMSPRLRQLSFGGPAAIVTSVALIVGLNAAHSDRIAIVSSLVVLALADNLTDALGLHIYQESERLPEREAFLTTVANFLTRLLVALSFVALSVLARPAISASVAILWGLFLLSGLSYLLARARQVRPAVEIAKHCGVALIVVALSAALGAAIPALLGQI